MTFVNGLATKTKIHIFKSTIFIVMKLLSNILILVLSLVAINCEAQRGKEDKEKQKAAKNWNIPEKTEAGLKKYKNKLDQFAYMLEGSYSSAKQHDGNPLEFYNITMHVYQIWKDRSDAKWFYVEQAIATLPDEPYRQRIYKVTASGRDTVVSEIYTLPNPDKFVGAWHKLLDKKAKGTLFDDLKVADLTIKEGCAVHMAALPDAVFKGATGKNTCVSDRKDSKFTVSDVSLTLARLTSWDRGYGDSDVQLWGAAEAYQFDRLTKDDIVTILEFAKANGK